MNSTKVSFINHEGLELAARIQFPVDKEPIAFAIFAHCFTCNKNLNAVRNIARAMASSGIALLSFDFAGLGESEGEFVETNLSTNITDIMAAAAFLSSTYQPPSLLVGHSLGGAASIMAACQIDSIKGVATIGSPSDPKHVMNLLREALGEIRNNGEATVQIGGRPFVVNQQFLIDLENKDMAAVIKGLRRAILILHSPQDTVVGIENAGEIYNAALHPKSFVSLDGADHILSKKEDSEYAGEVIATWAKRYLSFESKRKLVTDHNVVASLESEDGYTTLIKAGNHYLTSDEPASLGGDDFGPSPYGLVVAGLAACTAITLQMYARRKKWDLKEVRVHIHHEKVHADDCHDCLEEDLQKFGKRLTIDHLDRTLELFGDLDDVQRRRILQIANKCPVHKTLENSSIIHTKLKESS